MSDTYGKMKAEWGDRCSNPGYEDKFTTPCCYEDVDEDATHCPECDAPIFCAVEQQPVAVCTIGDDGDA